MKLPRGFVGRGVERSVGRRVLVLLMERCGCEAIVIWADEGFIHIAVCGWGLHRLDFLLIPKGL